jgi:hypothetical protein
VLNEEGHLLGVTQCSQVEVHRSFERTYCLHLYQTSWSHIPECGTLHYRSENLKYTISDEIFLLIIITELADIMEKLIYRRDFGLDDWIY